MTFCKRRKALVTKKFNDFFYVDILENNRLKDKSRFLCKSRKNISYKNQLIFVGDEVLIDEININDKTAIIVSLFKRKNQLIRPAVANVSDIYIVISVEEPLINYSQVNKFLINAESLQVKVSLILTKSDLISTSQKSFLGKKFEKWGYPPRIFDGSQASYLDFVNELKTKKCSILIGPSGVGKTTLLNKIIPSLNLPTSIVSEKIKRGKNTTRNIELFSLSNKSYIVDTPGFNLQNINENINSISDLFPEIRKQLNTPNFHCKFRDCLHIHEPGCSLDTNFERYEFYKELVSQLKTHSLQTQGD